MINHYSIPARFSLFLCLLTLSLIKPSQFLPIPALPLIPVTLCLMLILSLLMVLKNEALRTYYSNFKWELGLFFGYIFLSLVSLLLNLGAYSNFSEIVYFGIVPIAVTFSLVLLNLLFNPATLTVAGETPHKWRGFTLSVFVAFCIVAVWQFVDYFSANAITQYFVSSELPREKDHYNVRSLFRINTDFGPIMALLCVALCCHMRNLYRYQVLGLSNSLIFGLCLALFFFSGMISGSRNFLFTLAMGLLAFAIPLFRRRPKVVLVVAVGFLLLLQGGIFSSDTLRNKYGAYFPYINKIHAGQPVTANDFIPSLKGKNTSFTGRLALWNRALDEIAEQPLLGISNGAFKLSLQSESFVNNTHNLFFQVLVDSGIIGLGLVLMLLYRLHRIAPEDNKPLFWAILACLMFDYYLDHSLPWLICTAWLYFYLSKTSLLSEQVKSSSAMKLTSDEGSARV